MNRREVQASIDYWTGFTDALDVVMFRNKDPRDAYTHGLEQLNKFRKLLKDYFSESKEAPDP